VSKEQASKSTARNKQTFSVAELVQRGAVNPTRLKQTGLGAAMQQAVAVAATTTEQSAAGASIIDIPLAELYENAKLQPRLKVLESDVAEMAASLAEKGQKEPIQARRRNEGGYEIISGYHRFYGAKRAELPSLRAVVVELDDNEAWLFALISNDARTDMSDFERAYAYRHMLDIGLVASQTALANTVKRSKGRVSQCLKMLELPDGVQNVLMEHPHLFGYRTAADILEFREKHAAKHPNLDEIIAAEVAALVDGGKLYELLPRIGKKILGPGASKSPRAEATYVTDKTGRKVFSATNAERAITIKWPASVSHDSKKLMEHLMSSLQEFHAAEAQQGAKAKAPKQGK